MTGREAAVCLFAGLTVISAAGLAALRRMLRSRKVPPGDMMLTAGAALLCGLYAAYGWVWFLMSGVLR